MRTRVAIGDAAVAAVLARRAELEALARTELGKADFDAAAEVLRPHALAAVALAEEGALAGFLLAWLVADELHVHDVAVDPGWRRRGVGTSLVAAALAEARSRGARVALLEVRRSNRAAIKLYRSADFVAVRVRPAYYEAPVEDGVEMACALEPGALAGFERVEEE